MEYNIFIPHNKQWPTTMFSGEIIIRYDTLSRPLKQTNPLEFRLVVRALREVMSLVKIPSVD